MGARNSSIDRIIRKKKETGRPRGAISKKNKLLREMIEEFTDGNFHLFIIFIYLAFSILQNAKKSLKFHLHARGNTLVCFAFDVSFIFGVSTKS